MLATAQPPPVRFPPLGFHRTVAGRAVEVAAILELDSLKPIIDTIDPDSLVTIAVSLTVRLRKLDFASRRAIRAPKIFNPMVACGHPATMTRMPKRSNVVKATAE
jgi:hypothetical protein